MLNHGLDEPKYNLDDGMFVVTLMGPGYNLKRLRAPKSTNQGITPAIEEQLNDRQKKIVAQVVREGFVTSGWCRKQFKVTYDTANRDLLGLSEIGLLRREGQGRNTRFVLIKAEESRK